MAGPPCHTSNEKKALMPSKKFLDYLGQKLKTGNLRSIHLNTLPGRYATRLDMNRLDVIQTGVAEDFLDRLLRTPNFKFPVSFNQLNFNRIEDERKKELNYLARKLNGMYYQNNDNYFEHGIKTFGLGYPLLIKKSRQDPEKIIKAPLLVWHLDIDKSSRKSNVWEIIKDEDSPVDINEVLISYLKQDEGITLQQLSSDYLEDSVIDRDELVQICHEVLDKLNADPEQDFTVQVNPAPESRSIDRKTGDVPWISWSGVFGLYKAQKESLINEVEYLKANRKSFYFEKLPPQPYQKTSVSGVATDPSQEQIVNALNHNLARIIQGPPGTGKSQSLTAIITNALESGAKCLVVCEKKTAMDVIYHNLEQKGLGRFAAIIDDVGRDRRKIIGKVRNTVDEVKDYTDFYRQVDYHSALDRYNQIRTEINRRHQAVLTQVLGDDTWQDAIGHYMANRHLNRDSDPLKTLRSSLNSSDYSFDHEEFKALSQTLRDGRYHCEKIKTRQHPLEKLRSDIFHQPYLRSTHQQMEEELGALAEACRNLISMYDQYAQLYGRKFSANKPLRRKALGLLALFTGYHKKIVRAKRQVYARYLELARRHDQQQLFDFHFVYRKPKDYKQLRNKIEAYQGELNTLLEAFDQYREFHEWKNFYFNLPAKHKNLLDAMIDWNVEDREAAFRAWYYDHVLARYEEQLRPFHEDSSLINEFFEVERFLKEKQVEQITNLWIKRQQGAIARFKREKGKINSLYNYRKNKKYGRKNSLRKIIHTDFQFFSDIFPVLMVNPVVSGSVLPMEEGLFDVVIFDEASQLRLEDTFPSYLKGRYKIISGDEHQMPPSNYFGKEIPLGMEEEEEDGPDAGDESEGPDTGEWDDSLENATKESLLQYGVDSGFNKSYLDFHYRSRHPFLIDFSNAAFYGSRLTPTQPKNGERPIRFMQVDGIYRKDRTNPAEVDWVADLLFNQIPALYEKEMPSVGVATFNMNQRDRINDRLFKEIYADEAKYHTYEKLREKGLFVKNLENIQGEERDVIILSTTFGRDEQGRLKQHFGPINQRQGYKLFNVIITRAREKLYVCTSVPSEFYERYNQEIPEKGNTGRAVFYAYLAYARAVENGDEDTRQGILNLLSEQYTDDQPARMGGDGASPFKQQVRRYLEQHIDAGRIETGYEYGGFRFDFVIRTRDTGHPMMVLECDGASHHSSQTAYAHDLFRQKIVEQDMGLEYYRIWSTRWWPDPEKEVQGLVNHIQLKDEEVKEERQAHSAAGKETPSGGIFSGEEQSGFEPPDFEPVESEPAESEPTDSEPEESESSDSGLSGSEASASTRAYREDDAGEAAASSGHSGQNRDPGRGPTGRSSGNLSGESFEASSDPSFGQSSGRSSEEPPEDSSRGSSEGAPEEGSSEGPSGEASRISSVASSGGPSGEFPAKEASTPTQGFDQSGRRKKVTEDSQVTVKNLNDYQRITLAFTRDKDREGARGTGQKVLHIHSPVAKLLLSKSLGDRFRLEGPESHYYEIIDIDEGAEQ